MEEGGGFLSGARLRGASGAVRVVCPVARERERERGVYYSSSLSRSECVRACEWEEGSANKNRKDAG